MRFSSRAKAISPSATLAISGAAKKLKAEGKPVLAFSAGEPDFVSPPAAMEAARKAIDRGETHYTINSGIAELKSEVCSYYKRHFGLEYEPSEVLVASGAKPLVYEALQALVDPGDEVIVFSPAWVSYVEQIRLAGGREVAVDTSTTKFEPTAATIEAAFTSKTVGMIINTPNNPTGAVWSEAALRAVADAARMHGWWIIYDEIYERLVYDGAKHVNILNVAPDLRDQVIMINGVSKAFCMTGWRIGYALGPADAIKKMDSLQGHITSCASSIAQWAAVGALSGAEAECESSRKAFERRRKLICGLLKEVPGLRLEEPRGAFYVFFDVRGTKIADDVEFCRRLLEEKLVALVPGSAFLAPGHIRMSYACSEADLTEGAARIKAFVESL